VRQVVRDWASRWDAAKTNGCSKSPDLWMKEACDRHDRHYGTHRRRDGTKISRLWSDWEMLKDARRTAPGITPVDRFIIRNTIPTFYFVMVRCFGWKFW